MEKKIITGTAQEVFGPTVKVYLFGSRTDLQKKGGDIDLLIVSDQQISIAQQLKFLARIEFKGIERKVDLLIVAPGVLQKSIHRNAISHGVRIL